MEIPDDDLTPDDIRPGADLAEATLVGATLREADLEGADLRGSLFARVVLGSATLTNVRIDQGTRFTRRSRPTFGPRFRQVGFDTYACECPRTRLSYTRRKM